MSSLRPSSLLLLFPNGHVLTSTSPQAPNQHGYEEGSTVHCFQNSVTFAKHTENAVRVEDRAVTTVQRPCVSCSESSTVPYLHCALYYVYLVGHVCSDLRASVWGQEARWLAQLCSLDVDKQNPAFPWVQCNHLASVYPSTQWAL